VSDDALGQAEEGPFVSAMKARGITADVQLYPPSATDYTPVFQRAVADKPDWIYMDGAGSEVGILLTSRVKADGGSIPTIIGSDATSQPILSLAKGTNELDNTYAALLPTQAYIPPGKRGPEFKALLAAISKQPLATSIYVYSVGWDIINLWAEGARNVKGPVTVNSLRTSLEHLPPSTDPQFPLYKRTFTPQDHSPVASASDITFAQEVSTSGGFIYTKQ
jgi:ABC-type branched-subunit amino acid transport system substrate-binding protein